MRGDDSDRRPSGWRAPGTPDNPVSPHHADTRFGAGAVGRPDLGPSVGGRRGVLAVLAACVAIVLLTACLYAAVVPALTQALGALGSLGTASPAATVAGTAVDRPTSAVPHATVAQQGIATPASADWVVFTNYGGGFRVDVPGVLGSSHGYFINDFSGQGADFAYTGVPLVTPLQQREAQTGLSILYSTKITDQNICPQGGVPVHIGSGTATASAWQRDEGADVKVNLVLNGTAIEIALSSRDTSQVVLAQDGDIWRHMLASFAPLPGQPQRATHPCG